MSNKIRQLAAIMFTDMEGYTALMQENEAAALKQRAKHREIFESSMEAYGGKILQYFGDGTLSIFDSAIDAVRSGIAMQHRFLEEDTSIPVRIGIQTGDIIYSSEEIIGDGVNVASRIESLAVAGSVFISGKVFDELKNQPDINARFMGVLELKNVKVPVEVYAISDGILAIPDAKDIHGKGKLISLKGEVLTAEGRKGQGVEAKKTPKGKKDKPVIIALLALLVIMMGGFIIKEQFFPSTQSDLPAIVMDSVQSVKEDTLLVRKEVDPVKEEPEVLTNVVVEEPKIDKIPKVPQKKSVKVASAVAASASTDTTTSIDTTASIDTLQLANLRIDSLKNVETSNPLDFLQITATKTGLFKGLNALGETVITGNVKSTAAYATYVDLLLHITFFSEENQELKEYFEKIETVISPGETVELKLKLRAPVKSKDFEVILVSAEGLLRN